MVESTEGATHGRRAFIKKACCMGLGTAAVLAPIGAGVAVFLDPLRRKSAEGEFIRVTTLGALPEGPPRKFSIVTTLQDAWNRTPNVPIGAIYLRRTGPQTVHALNVVCPHAGCFVDFLSGRNSYLCPCHNSTFTIDGKINDPKSPSPRALDELAVEIRNGTEVWVKFQNFLSGTHEKIPA
jgi:menaquinol-cytochrome c reductase iron-sulfur subunit